MPKSHVGSFTLNGPHLIQRNYGIFCTNSESSSNLNAVLFWLSHQTGGAYQLALSKTPLLGLGLEISISQNFPQSLSVQSKASAFSKETSLPISSFHCLWYLFMSLIWQRDARVMGFFWAISFKNQHTGTGMSTRTLCYLILFLMVPWLKPEAGTVPYLLPITLSI